MQLTLQGEVERKSGDLAAEDQLAWRIAETASQSKNVEIDEDVREIVKNRLIDTFHHPTKRKRAHGQVLLQDGFDGGHFRSRNILVDLVSPARAIPSGSQTSQ